MLYPGMSTMRRRLAAVATALLVVGAIASAGATSASASVSASVSASDEDTVADLVNQARTSAELPGLIHNPAMDSVAVNWADQMSAVNQLSHNPACSSQITPGWNRAGESVAMGQPTASAMHTAWMDSPNHRANIFGNFTNIGIGIGTVNGCPWGVEDFGKYPGPAGSPAPALASIAGAPAAVMKASTVAADDVLVPDTDPAVGPAAAPRRATASPAHSETSAHSVTSAHSDATASPGREPVTLSATKSADQRPFPIGYVIGGILVIGGIGGGIYGQRLRIRGRRPPRP